MKKNRDKVITVLRDPSGLVKPVKDIMNGAVPMQTLIDMIPDDDKENTTIYVFTLDHKIEPRKESFEEKLKID